MYLQPYTFIDVNYLAIHSFVHESNFLSLSITSVRYDVDENRLIDKSAV